MVSVAHCDGHGATLPKEARFSLTELEHSSSGREFLGGVGRNQSSASPASRLGFAYSRTPAPSAETPRLARERQAFPHSIDGALGVEQKGAPARSRKRFRQAQGVPGMALGTTRSAEIGGSRIRLGKACPGAVDLHREERKS